MEDLHTLAVSPALPATQNRLKRWVLLSAGALLVGIGVLGIFLPLLPTTVFLLGAAACFARSSPGAYTWLTTNRWFGRYLRDYRENRGATAGTKVASVSSLWGGMALSAYLVQPPVWVDSLLAAIAIAVTWHLFSLKSIRA